MTRHLLWLALLAATPAAADDFRRTPPPALDLANPAPRETAYLAGGCFWGVEGVYDHVRGVISATSGYAGGSGPARYDRVSDGNTGHAESVKIVFDPRIISYARLLQIYFSVVADPTQVNRQGPDTGTQYRTALFPTGDRQAKQAQAYIAQLERARLWKAPIATRLERGARFTTAEAYHQDYMARHPYQPYIVANDAPKLAALKRLFPDLYRG